MSLNKQHEIHTRRFSRNLGVGVVLGAFIAIIFGLTIVKVSRGDYEPARPPAATEATQ
ncbi:hypothetical protein P775_21895 [Puniceibacterium antarcticum]|uniref:Cytochrome C oxidase assembly protein n=1 Tax=Puniceibacterium antarcticum TaxID=1206336 RepID=A0A2G8R961_9RHOB|nr:hypothetical protein [Puniceibacterium antarcticum]PIL18077.1 hypothetical protein P775_21895 [Puniceibacterium antarcticum]